ncbi:MAG: hypothetical protein IJO63_05365 [Bacilli bacterium]|nr:hypothetical protein [Bacilli bacterium]
MKMSKTNIVVTGLALLMLLLVTVSATYAYFSGNQNLGNGLTVGAETDAPASFTAYTADQIALNVSAEDMAVASTTPAVTDNGKVIALLSSSSEDSVVHCTYDIELVWDSTTQYTVPSMTFNSDYKYELSLKGTQSVSGDTSGHTYTVTTLNETNLTDFTWSGSAGTVGRKAKVVTGAEIYSKSLTATTATWNFVLNFYSLPADQDDITGKSYNAHLTVSNVVC